MRGEVPGTLGIGHRAHGVGKRTEDEFALEESWNNVETSHDSRYKLDPEKYPWLKRKALGEKSRLRPNSLT